jgi:predicted RNase H-like nuclease
LNAVSIAVDMPIGLADRGRRGCDEAARKAPHLRPSSIFPMPVRGALLHDSYAEANAWSKANGYGGVVKQAWNLKPKLLDVERVALNDPRAPVYEAHPELAFARLAGQRLASKKTSEGREQRLALLDGAGIQGLPTILAQVPRALAAPDDVLDAAVLLVTAKRIRDGAAICYPDTPIRNAQGIVMRIWV